MNDDLPQNAPPKAGIVPAARLWAMKRRAQARDQALLKSGVVAPEAMLLVGPERLAGARVEWPDADALDD